MSDDSLTESSPPQARMAQPRYVSCAFDALYPAGIGFPEAGELPAGGAVSVDGAFHGITYLDELYPRVEYGEPFSPAIFAQDSPSTRNLWTLYETIAVKTAMSSVVVSVDDAMVYGSVLYAQPSDARAIVYETYRPNDRPAVAIAPPMLLDANAPFDFDDDADYLFVASAGSANYGHFLVDDAPRLKACAMLRARSSDRRIVVVMSSFGAGINAVRKDAVLALAGTPVDVLFLDSTRVYRFRRLYYPSPCSVHPIEKNPAALDFVAETLAADISLAPLMPTKLFIARKAVDGRSLLNLPELVARLVDRGFELVHPEDLTFIEQVTRFACASVVVGQMGAAMTNTMFCGRDTTLIYLAPNGWIEPFYWDLALARKQNYRALYGQVTTPNVPTHTADFVIAKDELLALLD